MSTSGVISTADTKAGLREGGSRRVMVATLIVFLLIVLVRRSIIDAPPYWDHAIGLWTEANFLAETRFDYHRLWTAEKPIWQGGARCYLTSVLPTLVAGLMCLMPTARSVLVVCHLLTFLAAAASLVLVYVLLVPHVGRWAALLTSTAVGTNPLFSTQVDMVGMEIPLALLVLLTVYFVVHQRFPAAAMAGLLAFGMKASGIIATAAIVAYTGMVLLFDARTASQPRRRVYVTALLVNLVVLAFELAAILAAGHVASQLVASHRTRAPGLGMMLFWSPDVLFILLAVAIAIAIGVAKQIRRDASPLSGQSALDRWWRAASRLLADEPLTVIASLMIVATLISISRVILLPRYLVMAVPLVFMLAGICLFRGRTDRRWPAGVAGLLVLVNLLNWNGQLYPNQAWVIETAFDVEDGAGYARTGAFLERSHEYLADHRANIAAVKRLVEQQHGVPPGAEPVIVGTPLIHFLAFPRLGYVPYPLQGFAANPFTDFVDNFPPATPEVLQSLPRRPVIIFVGNTFYRLANTFQIPPPGDGDEPLYDDHQPSPLIVYRKGWPKGPPNDERLARWYVERMWPHDLLEERAMHQAEALSDTGHLGLAIKLLRSAAERRPSNVRLRLELSSRLQAAGDRFRALAEGMSALAITGAVAVSGEYDDLGNASAFDDRGFRRLRQGDVTGAAGCFLAAAKRFPSDSFERFASGVTHLYLGQLDKAVEELRAAIEFEPQRGIIHEYLGRALLRQGRFAEAAAALKTATAEEADAAEAHYFLGLALARQQRFRAAVDQFQRAVALRPGFKAASEKLARLRNTQPPGDRSPGSVHPPHD